MKREVYVRGVDYPLPDLIQIQKESYERFLKKGLKELFEEISPIEDFTGELYSLRFGDYFFEEPKEDPLACRENNLTYKASLRCRVSLENKKTGEIKEQEIYLGDFPMMTERGTFIINGVERVIVNQILRSYGVTFVMDLVGGEKLFGAKLIPARGAWLEFETSPRGEIYVKIDRRRRTPVTALLKFLGYDTPQKIKALFEKELKDAPIDFIEATLKKDPSRNPDEACVYIYRQMRPGDMTTPKNARTFLETTFFTLRRYDLGPVGRYKINQRLGLNFPIDLKHRILQKEDVVETIREIIRLNSDPNAEPDDIDHLANRRVRTVGELVQDRVRIGLLRMERIIKDRMSVADPALVTPASLINARPISAVLQEFFASSQLSQFMNQTNPLSELEHKRTVAATGPGGLSRERAGFEVRDVHTSHYGRICPVQTPECPNIGLVTYLASYARINEYGFLETPYRKVKHTKRGSYVTDEIVYLDAAEEEKYVIAPADIPTAENGRILVSQVMARHKAQPQFVSVKKLDFVDVASNQIVSVSTSLIPFLENTDAARALMGSNMQRQALPLVKPEAPIVGTGVEEAVGKASGMVVIAEEPGVVKEVDAQKIVVENNKKERRTYKLFNFLRSNQST
ncbi:DNA-directed RNA polymerase subunit beta, partial [bacterium]|nr:DNA-directed RNA polymerase subunit beta [bacterium]